MTRRQIYFHVPERNIYYVSEEINGDKAELEQIGSNDSCEKTWVEILDELKEVSSLEGFLRALALINGCYHSSLGEDRPLTRLRIVLSYGDIGLKDQTYGITNGISGAFLDNTLSIWKEVETA